LVLYNCMIIVMRKNKKNAMRKLLTNICLVASLGLVIVIVSFAVSVCSGQWHWFSRSGSILTVAAVILTVRPIIRLGLRGLLEAQSVIDGGHATPTPEEIEAENQQKLDAKSSLIGLFLLVIGAVIWGYGELLGGLPK
jgi:hypothetical protein